MRASSCRASSDSAERTPATSMGSSLVASRAPFKPAKSSTNNTRGGPAGWPGGPGSGMPGAWPAP
eukprot:7605585-Lingulodinium_polyedra.AAC.1